MPIFKPLQGAISLDRAPMAIFHGFRKPHYQVMGALVVAALLGTSMQQGWIPDDLHPWVLHPCQIAGEWFMRGLKLMILPIVFTSMVCGIAGTSGSTGIGKLWLKTGLFYFTTTLIAAATGLFAVNCINPGMIDGRPNESIRTAIHSSASPTAGSDQLNGHSQDSTWVDSIARLVPSNLFKAASDSDLLGWIFVSLLFGLALALTKNEAGQLLRDMMHGLNQVVLRMTGWVMAFAPIGVFALVTPVVQKTGSDLFQSLGWYVFTVMAGLIIHSMVTMPLVLRIGGVSPIRHFHAMRDALLTAFCTASSNATVPVSMRCVTEQAGVSPRVAGLTIPLGATVNMNGTALYECVAVMFVAQVLAIDLSLSSQLAVVALALVSSIGVAGIPSASMVAIVMILETVGIPGSGAAVAVLLSVDRLLDMSRTAVNVFGDTCAAVVIARSEGEQILQKTEST